MSIFAAALRFSLVDRVTSERRGMAQGPAGTPIHGAATNPMLNLPCRFDPGAGDFQTDERGRTDTEAPTLFLESAPDVQRGDMVTITRTNGTIVPDRYRVHAVKVQEATEIRHTEVTLQVVGS